MKLLFWLLLMAAGAGLAYWWRGWRRRHAEREQAAAARMASFMAQARAAAPPPADPAQKLLFDAAAKAGEANEPALAIQLYARLLARFPNGGFAPQARAALELQKSKLTKS